MKVVWRSFGGRDYARKPWQSMHPQLTDGSVVNGIQAVWETA